MVKKLTKISTFTFFLPWYAKLPTKYASGKVVIFIVSLLTY